MGPQIFLCYLVDVPPGTSKILSPKELATPVLVTNCEGNITVTTAICPHEDVTFSEDSVQASTITCHGHGYQFDLKTGQCLHDKSLCLTRYRVSVAEGQITVAGVPVPK